MGEAGSSTAGVGLGSGEITTDTVAGIVCVEVGCVGKGAGGAEHAARKKRLIAAIGVAKIVASGVSGVCRIVRSPVPGPYSRTEPMKARGDSVGP
jgi:hypothetical protein